MEAREEKGIGPYKHRVELSLSLLLNWQRGKVPIAKRAPDCES